MPVIACVVLGGSATSWMTRRAISLSIWFLCFKVGSMNLHYGFLAFSQ